MILAIDVGGKPILLYPERGPSWKYYEIAFGTMIINR